MPDSIKSFRLITENYTGMQIIVKGLANIMVYINQFENCRMVRTGIYIQQVFINEIIIQILKNNSFL